MAKPRLFSGARAILKFNESLLIYATDVSYIVETEYRQIQTIDNSLPEDLAPGRINVQVSCSSFRVPLGSATVEGIQATIMNNLTQPYTTIELRDRQTDQIILYVPKAQMVRRTGKVGSKDIGSETWTFIGTSWMDERPPAKATV